MVVFIIDFGYVSGRGFGLAIKAGADRLRGFKLPQGFFGSRVGAGLRPGQSFDGPWLLGEANFAARARFPFLPCHRSVAT